MATRKKLGPPKPVLVAAVAGGPGPSKNTGGHEGTRITMTCSGGGAGNEVQVEGSADGVEWYPLWTVIVFAADGTQSLWLDEPNTFIRVNVTTYIAGQIDAVLQELG